MLFPKCHGLARGYLQLFRAFENFLCVIEHSPAPIVTLSETEFRNPQTFLRALSRAGKDERAARIEREDDD